MIKLTSILLGALATLLVSLSSGAQPLNDPAVTTHIVSPAPIPGGIGTPVSLTFAIGNLGTAPISGSNGPNRMAFGICLGYVAPATGQTDALASISGPLLDYFDIIYNPSTFATAPGCYEGRQKAGVAIPAGTVFEIYIRTVLVALSPNNDQIGASCNIAPNPSANPQPQNNDFVSAYTRTVVAQPVSLVSFVAQAQQDRSVFLNWTTSWEQANKGYVIERSKDLKSFEMVGEVSDVAGSSNSINAYKFVDKSPYRGTSYYRLVQVDLDGSRHSYKAEGVMIDGRYGVYPNPVVGHSFTLELDEPGSAILHLYDISGREVSVSKSEMTEISTKVTPGLKLIPGLYLLMVEERGLLRRHRLVVQ